MKNLRSQGSPADGETTAKELTERIAAAYDGKSSVGMWKEILAEAEKARRAGTLTDADIDEFYTQFAPMLEPSQQKMLKTVVERLKSV